MLHSLQPVHGFSARYCTIQDRGDVWPTAAMTDALLPDFGGLDEGLLPGRQIATDQGWRPVETLAAGDLVLTFEHGLRRLEHVGTAHVGTASQQGRVSALHVPAGAIGNRRGITLLPAQLVLLDCDFAEARFGDPFILVPAAYLEGYKGITATKLTPGLTSYMLGFANREIIHADGSALLSCYAVERSAQPAQPSLFPRLSQAQVSEFRQWVQNQIKPFGGAHVPPGRFAPGNASRSGIAGPQIH